MGSNKMMMHHWQERFTGRSQRGFTLAEVLASILITGAFTVAAFQALIVAAAFQADAKKFSEASNWIQEDLENIKIVAYDLCQTRYVQRQLDQPVLAGNNTITLGFIPNGSPDYAESQPPAGCPFTSATDGLRVGDDLLIGSDAQTNKIASISGNTVTLTQNINSNRSVGARVFARCRAGTQNGGFGAYLQDLLPNLNSSGSKLIVNQTYTMTRTATIRNVAPFEILEVNYRVQNANNNVIAQLSTEVVPNAFFRCP
ncbi:prepilin-type N-terminal cleavage/methylation domain-containing protein [Candidatus Synechococcus calcipolaris G9]|uniref:Prepilin-type N-terminal cleavage/methylation domain-containing protein n=1 Tax=Candidatus Synechococcus calcipolaris G9 TaxID=1497997 RepID=A0ABT6EWV1_9SYNE|nr:prepilin-type N-terminal cleavage/methylation domain-containing protein [Candidatus Synechococcus calcipolaris]MDG2990255.1 prepilin-type N-terminal cleavage/methylation domain-containing protein [Candidatus Synechococcus calcipolaris G9]